MWPGRNFRRHEFACRCGCGFATVDAELLAVLDALRDEINRPLMITSGCRCPDHNRRVGGRPESKHLQGIAADVLANGVPPKDIYQHLAAIYPASYGLILYTWGVHVDVRPEPYRARW